jgi:hypothetical protein
METEDITMSFLDATGLGTFWAKLKSTFQGPVSEIYKDALTPINLLANSDFSRNGGYANTTTIDLPLNNTHYKLRQSWSINRINNASHNSCTITNLTVTFSSNSLNIQFDKTQGTFYLFIQNDNSSVLQNQIYTFLADVVFGSDNYNNSVQVIPGTGSTSEDVYKNNETDHKISVTKNTYAGTVHYQLAIQTGKAPEDEHLLDAGHVNITIKNPALYKGEYKDAPVSTSLDVKGNNQFRLKNVYDDLFYQATQKCEVFNTYYSTLTTYNKYHSLPTGNNVDLYLARSAFTRASYGNIGYLEFEIFIYPVQTWNNSVIFKKYDLKVFVHTIASGSITIKKVLTLDSDTSYISSNASTYAGFPDLASSNIALDTSSDYIYVALRYSYNPTIDTAKAIGMSIYPKHMFGFNPYSPSHPTALIHFNREQ